jgi:hypothetical protein
MWWGLYSYCSASYFFSFNTLNFYFQIAVKSCKQVSKNISEMSKELEAIGQVTNVGELPGKLQDVEEAKVDVENQLLERVSKFGCSDHVM